MSEAPERILAYDDGAHVMAFDSETSIGGAVSYTRSDLCDRDAIRAEAFEEAALAAEKFIPPTYITERGVTAQKIAAAIRTKAEGGNRT